MRFLRQSLGVLTLSFFAASMFGQSSPVSLFFPNTVIDQPGSYALDRDLAISSTNSPAIMIIASGVTLNLNGHAITGPGTNNGVGVMINGASGVTVLNGSLANLGFGVVVSNSSNVTIRNLNVRALDLAVAAPPPETGVMIIESTGVVVDSNNFQSVGLGIFVRGGMSRGNRITNNNVTAGMHGALGICFNPAPGDPAGPSGQFVANNSVYGFPTGISITSTSGANVFKDNTVFYTSGMGIAANGTSIQDVNNTLVALK